MAMVFCRGCGKEIHETAPTCPMCGAPQVGPAQGKSNRGAGGLILWGFV
jgi:rRNA maturation endonuclease Nob1